MSAEVMVPDQDVRRLLTRRESRTLEFKSHTPDVATISRLLSAFANTEGGTLIVGVREGGEVVGADVPRLLRAVEEARRMLNPPQQIHLHTPTIDGKQIGIVHIDHSEVAPVFADAGVFVREGEVARPMTAEDLTRRLQQAPQPPDQATLVNAIANQTVLIETLRLELRAANCWKSKMTDYFIGGIIGAVLGALASLFIKY